jgi:heat shock protein HslJ
MKCLDGECVPDYIIEKESPLCKPGQEADDDQDGIPNNSDRCYNPGCTIIDEHGCPRDTDGDGLPDCDDDCPGRAGDRANNGCPVEEQVEFEGTVWNLDTYRNSQGSLVGVLQNTEITAQFQNGTVGGSSGCNSYSGDYTISGNALTIGALSITLMYCTMPNGVMAQEGDYIAALKSVTSYRINGNTLIMTNAAGDVVLVFTAV